VRKWTSPAQHYVSKSPHFTCPKHLHIRTLPEPINKAVGPRRHAQTSDSNYNVTINAKPISNVFK